MMIGEYDSDLKKIFFCMSNGFLHVSKYLSLSKAPYQLQANKENRDIFCYILLQNLH